MRGFDLFAAVMPDPIKWVDDLVSVCRFGAGEKISWYKCSGWRGVDVETVLGKYGVRVYRRDYGRLKDTQGLHVPKRQAKWADWLLRRAGCPVASPALSAVKDGDLPAAWGVPAKSVGLAGALVRMWAPVPSGRRVRPARPARRSRRRSIRRSK